MSDETKKFELNLYMSFNADPTDFFTGMKEEYQEYIRSPDDAYAPARFLMDKLEMMAIMPDLIPRLLAMCEDIYPEVFFEWGVEDTNRVHDSLELPPPSNIIDFASRAEQIRQRRAAEALSVAPDHPSFEE